MITTLKRIVEEVIRQPVLEHSLERVVSQVKEAIAKFSEIATMMERGPSFVKAHRPQMLKSLDEVLAGLFHCFELIGSIKSLCVFNSSKAIVFKPLTFF